MTRLVVMAPVLLAATPAWALCPNCLGQSPFLPTTLRLVGLFLLVPPAVFATVALVVRKIVRQSVSRSVRRSVRQSVPPSVDGGDHGG